MRWRKYTKYKDSGIAWLGEIPENWEIKPVWMLFKLGRGRVISHEEINEHVGEYPVFSSQTENDGILGFIDTYEFDGNYLTWTTDGANAGTVFKRQGRFNCTNVCGTLSAKGQQCAIGFFRYAIDMATQWFVRHDINPKLMNNVMASIRIPVPKHEDQQAIATFLDSETSRIDTLIAKKERQIELMQEKRSALISRAVTKGLNPDAKMKDSGIEWMGKIPEHWRTARAKYCSKINMGQSPDSEDCNLDGISSPFLQGNAEFGSINPVPRQYCDVARKAAQKGDILISVRAPVGALNVADQDYGIGRGLCGITVHDSCLKSSFCWYLLHHVRTQLNLHVTGSTYDAVAVDDVENIIFLIPPVDDQRAIAAFLDHETSRTDMLTSKIKESISRLREYRTALISAAVTGKIDVRLEGT